MTQTHPQYYQDRRIVSQLLAEEPTDYNLAELARLRIRYRGFPGAADIQRDLDELLKQWQLSEEALFARTREIHSVRPVYRIDDSREDDWS